jgi:hypothetical protein
MDSLLFGIVMLAMGWLTLWCCIDHSRPSKTWWPFDFRLVPTKDTQERPSKPGRGRRVAMPSPRRKPYGS